MNTWLAFAQVSGTYGREVAHTLVENCGNTLILRCSASERGGTSEFASKLIGQREVVHTTESKSRKPAEWLATTTTSQQVRIEPAVMASEIEQLPDLYGFLKLASVPDWKRVRLIPVRYPLIARKREVQQPASSTMPSAALIPPAAPAADTAGLVPAAQPLPAGPVPPRRRAGKPVGEPLGGAELPD